MNRLILILFLIAICGCHHRDEPVALKAESKAVEFSSGEIGYWLERIDVYYCKEQTNWTIRACGINVGPFNSLEDAQSYRTNWAAGCILKHEEMPIPCGVLLTNITQELKK